MSTHDHASKPVATAPARRASLPARRFDAPAAILQRMENAPQRIRPADILQLQRTIGNHATARIIQAKLKLGPAGDKYEQEADRVAQQVVRASRHPEVQRNDAEEDELQAKPLAGSISSIQRIALTPALTQRIQRYSMDEEEEIQAKRTFGTGPLMPGVQREEMDEEELQASPNHGLEGGDVDEGVARSIQSAKGGGAPLHDGVRLSMEQGFGADFSGVRIHTGGEADALNRSLNARAFTTGSDIFFGKGQYNPGSTGGQELIAHELTHTVQQGAAGIQRFTPGDSVQRQPGPASLIQRAPNLARLSDKLGRGKYGKVVAAKQTEYFDGLTDDQLERYRRMQNDQFEKLVNSLKESLLSSVGGGTATFGQIVDLLGSVVETGEEASKIIPMLPQLLQSLSSGLLAGGDTVMEGFGGGIGGIKDTIEGTSSVVKQQKYVEGGLTTLGGLSGLASLIPGIPDFVGMAGAGAKSMGGIAKISNVVINQRAIAKLRSDGASNPALGQALDVLDAKLDHWSYIEGAMQTGLGAMEGVGAFYGSLAKYVTAGVSKGTETAYNWLPYLGRAIGSYTGLVDSNTTVKEKEETEKTEGKRKMWGAVESVESVGQPEHIGRLHRLAVLIEPVYAEEIDHAVGTLSGQLRQTVKNAIKRKATWNPG